MGNSFVYSVKGLGHWYENKEADGKYWVTNPDYPNERYSFETETWARACTIAFNKPQTLRRFIGTVTTVSGVNVSFVNQRPMSYYYMGDTKPSWLFIVVNLVLGLDKIIVFEDVTKRMQRAIEVRKKIKDAVHVFLWGTGNS